MSRELLNASPAVFSSLPSESEESEDVEFISDDTTDDYVQDNYQEDKTWFINWLCHFEKRLNLVNNLFALNFRVDPMKLARIKYQTKKISIFSKPR